MQKNNISPIKLSFTWLLIKGTIGNLGSVSAMISGKMELLVLRMLHPKWVKEMEHEGKLIVVDDKK